MTNKISTIDTSEGTITINSELFTGYYQEALSVLDAIAESTKDFNEIVETVAENTGMKKAKVAKYFKERFAEKTKATKEIGELFGTLDELMA